MTKAQYTAAVAALLASSDILGMYGSEVGWYGSEIDYGFSHNIAVEICASNIERLESDDE